MNATTMSTQFIDVEFSQLNQIASKLRINGAAINVSKLGERFRIFIKKNPQLLTKEEILKFELLNTNTESDLSNSQLFEPTTTHDSLNAIAKALPVTPLQESVAVELATLDELFVLNITKLRKLGKAYRIAGYSKMNSEKLADKLQGKVSKLEAM